MNNSSEEGKVIASQSIESMQHKLARTELNFGFQTAKRSFNAVLSSQQPHRVIVSPSCLIDFSFKWKNRIRDARGGGPGGGGQGPPSKFWDIS